MYRQVAIRLNGTFLKAEFYIDMYLQRGRLISGFSSLVKISKTVYMKLPPEIGEALFNAGVDLKNDTNLYDVLFLLNNSDPESNNKGFEIIAKFTPKMSGELKMIENKEKGEKY